MTKQNTTNQAMSLTPVYEIIRLKAERRKLPKKYLAEKLESYTIRTPGDFGALAMRFIGDEDREVFLVACVSVKNEVLSLHRCHVGTLNSSMVSPREVFKTAIMQNAASIIIAHNHPSSNVEPSPEDIGVTNRLVESGQLLGIEVLDHLIVSNHRYLSLREKGFMM